MNDALVIALVAVMSLVVLDAAVVAGLVVARKLNRARTRRRSDLRPVLGADLGTVLHTLPEGHDVAPAMAALAHAGYAALVDPEHPRTLLVCCPSGASQRGEVASLLAREAQRTSRSTGPRGY